MAAADVVAADSPNPLLSDFDFPPYDAITAAHVRPGVRSTLKQLEVDLDELEKSVEPKWEKLVEPLEKIIDKLIVVWGIVNHLKSVKDSPELRSAIEEVQPEKVKFELRLGQSKPIYNAFRAIRESSDWPQLSETRKRIVEYQLREAILSGVSLDDDKREQFNKVQQELKKCSQKFGENVLDATKKFEKLVTDKKEIEGLPATALGLAAQTAASKVSMAMKMATVDKAEELLEKLRSASWNPAVQDMEEIKSFAKQQGAAEADNLTHWDINFWSERLRESKYDINEEELRPYFSLPNVMDGLFSLAKKLFGIDIEPADGLATVWNEDVRFYRVKDSSGALIAYFYFDPYSRPSEKRGGAWMGGVFSRSRALSHGGAPVRLPVAVIVCNQTPPVGEKPSLMTFYEVETVFHEFGHSLQHMLTRQDESLVAGLRGIEWDAVEIPSQFMENWCYHRNTLMGIAKHYETGEILPEGVYNKLLAAKTFRAGSSFLRQLRFATLDLELHSRFVPGGSESIYDVDQHVSSRTQVLPPLPEDRFLCSFSHIFAGGYAAGYYSYKWAEVLSADAFSAFEDVGLDDDKAVIETGRRFRDTILSLGGGKAPLEVFVKFRGREPSPEPLLRHNGLLTATASA
ncbi:hypothetical protein RND81_02G142200 [Saponaria officinalis]|uniref:oligopeptidase A n=1 Tax=Saponaria officinalis TaxID=3572 RepID=A0AAW1MU72_SAPOF